MIKNELIELLPLLLLLVFVWKAKPVKPFSEINNGYLSQTTGKALRGFFAIVIMLHHLAQETESGILFHQLSKVGTMVVAVFFFFSGYGLQKSYIKSQDYQKKFLLRRLPTVLIPYIVVSAYYWIWNYICGIRYSLWDVVGGFFRGQVIVANAWYVVCILMFYIVFWLLMLLCKRRYSLMVIGGCIWYALYALYCYKQGSGYWWYNAAPLLMVGMLWATYEEKLNCFIRKHYVICFGIAVTGFGITCLIPQQKFVILISMAISSFFVLSVLLISMKVKIGNSVLYFLGEISFEIYIIHGLFFSIFRGKYLYIRNDFLWATLVVGCTVALSYITRLLCKKLLSVYKKAIVHGKLGIVSAIKNCDG